MVLTQRQVRLKKTLHIVVEEDPVIIKIESFNGEYVETEDVEEIRKANLELSGGGPFMILLDTSQGHAPASPEANKLMASKEFAGNRKGIAIIARSLATKLLSNFFIRFNKPHTPTRVFTDEVTALEWLKNISVKD
jgi:hypothetical protein